MSIRNDRREAAIERMADYLVAEGLNASTLRPLAAAAGTSDRMLLYYFADKDELLKATLERVAGRMIAQLDAAVPMDGPRPFRVLLEEVWTALGTGGVKPFMHLWLDLAAGSARGLQPHRAISSAIAEGFLAWAASRLETPDVDRASLSAATFLVCIEGMLIAEAHGRRDIAERGLAEITASLRAVVR
jgi:AcrR family transcriptional regulator